MTSPTWRRREPCPERWRTCSCRTTRTSYRPGECLTWALVAWSGSLVKLPEVLAQAAYGILVAVMLMTGRLVARETGRAGLGLAAMAAVGTTSVMASPACWYSAGQTLWAGFGILATLWYAQCWRRRPSIAALVLAAVSAALAGWFWTIGYMAGPVAAVYLWLDGRRRCRLAAAVPSGRVGPGAALGHGPGRGQDRQHRQLPRADDQRGGTSGRGLAAYGPGDPRKPDPGQPRAQGADDAGPGSDDQS